VREPSWALLASVAAAGGAMTLTHPPHSALVLVVLGGFLVARAILARRDFVSLGAALFAVAIPTGAVALWLRPILHETAAHNPGARELRHAFASYPRELDVFGLHSYRLKPELFGRGGAIAVAALVLLPLAVFARRRLWAALALGGMLAALAVSLLTFVFPHFADAVSISQARRLVGFSPRAFVLAGGAIVLARLLGPLVLPVGLAAGILLQWWVPGSFGSPYRPGEGGPAWLTWASFAAAAAVLLLAALVRKLPQLERDGPLATAAVVLFLLPVAVYGYSRWSPPATARQQLPAAVERGLRARLPERAVVFTDPQTGYELVAALPVYVNATPAVHSSDTRANHPDRRDREAERFFFHHGPLSVAHRAGAGWLLVDEARDGKRPFALPRAWADGRYVLYRLK
jgi:hypothetical protein